MIRLREKDFISSGLHLELNCAYQSSLHTKELFGVDEHNNTVENWELSISKQADINNEIWMTLLARDKNGKNITQIDFMAFEKKKLKEFINDLIAVYNFNYKK